MRVPLSLPPAGPSWQPQPGHSAGPRAPTPLRAAGQTAIQLPGRAVEGQDWAHREQSCLGILGPDAGSVPSLEREGGREGCCVRCTACTCRDWAVDPLEPGENPC